MFRIITGNISNNVHPIKRYKTTVPLGCWCGLRIFINAPYNVIAHNKPNTDHPTGPRQFTSIKGVYVPAIKAFHAREILNIRRRMNKLYSDHCNRSIQEIEQAVERDNFMSAEEAKSFGLIDKVITKVDESA